jgi:hypothetical protein
VDTIGITATILSDTADAVARMHVRPLISERPPAWRWAGADAESFHSPKDSLVLLRNEPVVVRRRTDLHGAVAACECVGV